MIEILSFSGGKLLMQTKGSAFAIKEELPEIHTLGLGHSFEEKEMSYGNQFNVMPRFGVDVEYE
jgi:hypothetical protein